MTRKNFNLESVVRDNIRRLTPYSSARHEFTGTASIFLDANENSFGSPIKPSYNRYPDPMQTKIKEKLALRNDVKASNIFVGNGSDEAIDLLFRAFCEPKRDKVLICPPTYGMYEVSAEINDVEIQKVNLTSDFQLDLERIRNAIDENTKLLFICSPNNPTGNCINRESILDLAADFDGIVVIDEAYIHFSGENSLVADLRDFENLVVLQTFSKAWGLAGLRVGLAFASNEVIEVFNRVKPPYNVSGIAQDAILCALDNSKAAEQTIDEIIAERAILAQNLSELECVRKIYPSDANFVLVKTSGPDQIYRHLIGEQIVVRNRSNVEMCEGSLRITVGTPKENDALLGALSRFDGEKK